MKVNFETCSKITTSKLTFYIEEQNCKEKEKEKERQREDGQIDRRTDRQTDRKTEIETVIHIYSYIYHLYHSRIIFKMNQFMQILVTSRIFWMYL